LSPSFPVFSTFFGEIVHPEPSDVPVITGSASQGLHISDRGIAL
jgi:hypothetical protein